jgi:ParB/RepB/Spo0J family partition protein
MTPINNNFQTLDPRNVTVIPGRNTRFDFGDLKILAESIKERGMLQPCRVQLKDGEYQLIDGHRRYMACMSLVEKGIIPDFIALVIDENESEAYIFADMITSNDGKHFLPLEEAEMLQRLRDDPYNWSQADIAKRIGKSLSHVSNRIALLNADDSVKEAMKSGELKTNDALGIIRKSNGDKAMQRQIINKIKTGDTNLVDKELLKGRFNVSQWELIHNVFNDLENYEITCNGIKECVISDDDSIQTAFIAGRFQGIADLAFTDIKVFYEKVKRRVEGERENSIIR